MREISQETRQPSTVKFNVEITYLAIHSNLPGANELTLIAIWTPFLYISRIEEYWEPKIAELERLRVNRDLPAITILLSKMELDTATPGYVSAFVLDLS